MNYQEFMNGGQASDLSTGLKQLVAKKKQVASVTQPISQERQLNLARDFYNNKTQVAWPYAPARSFASAQGTVLPLDTPVTAWNKVTPNIEAIQTAMPTINQNRAQSTPAVDLNAQWPVSSVFWAVRATSDLATLPFTTPVAAIDKTISVRDIYNSTLEQARKDTQGGGQYSINKTAEDYVTKVWLKKDWIYTGKQPTVKDIAYLSWLWFQNIFGDPLIWIPSLKAVQEFAIWKNTGTIERQLPEFTQLWTKDVGSVGAKNIPVRQFNAGKTKEVWIGNDVKIKIIPKENSVVYKWYIRRSAQWKVLNDKSVIDWVAEEVSNATGKNITSKVVWNDLVLTAQKESPVVKWLKDLSVAKQARTAAVKWAQVVAKAPITPTTQPSVAEPPIKKQKIIKPQIDPEKTFYHGTTANFDTFDLAKAGSNTEWDNAKFGIFFLDDAKVAHDFVSENLPPMGKEKPSINVKEVKLNIKKPIDLTVQWIVTKKEQASTVVLLLNGEKMSPTKALALLNEEIDLGTVWELYEELYKSLDNKKIIQDAGYDGIISQFGDWQLEYVALDPSQITIIKKESPIAKWLKDIVAKKTERVSAVSKPDIKTRLAEEKAAYAAKEQGGAVTETTVNLPKETSPVAPNFKTTSSYEIGEYYKKKELWDAKQKPVKQQVSIKKEDKAGKLSKQYNELQSREDPTDEDFTKMMQLEDNYRELTWKEIALHATDSNSLDGASTNRVYRDELLAQDEVRQAMWSKRAQWTTIGKEAPRTLNEWDQRILAIETGREKFSVAQETLKIVRKYKMKLMRNVSGTEGHTMGNIIWHDSLNNPLLLAHELTHYLTNDRAHVLMLNSDPWTKSELIKVYKKYYPGSPKDKKLASDFIVLNEGMAEFVRQHLFDPEKMNKEFPNLSSKFLNHWPLERKEVSEMYDEMNKIVYIYQNLSPLKQKNALMASDINFKKEGLKSIVVGRAGRIQAYSQDALYPFNAVDKLRSTPKDNTYFTTDDNWISSELLASMSRPSLNIALDNLNPLNDVTNFMNEKGDIEELLPFNVGKLLKEIHDNWDYEDYGSYLNALDSRRDRLRLDELKKNLIDQVKEANLEEVKTKRAKIDAQITKTIKETKRYENIIKSQPESAAKQDIIIKENQRRFAQYQDRLSEIFRAHLKLKERSGVITKKAADEMIARPGYSPSFRMMVSDVDEFIAGVNKRSSLSGELKQRMGSNKPVINALAVLPKLHVATLAKFNSQAFYNSTHDKLKMWWLAQDLWKGTASEPGTYIYSDKGKLTKFRVLDPVIVKSIEATYGRQWFDNNFAKALDYIFHWSARTFQKFTTQYNPYFAFFKNLALDIPTSYVFSKTGYKPGFSQVGRKASELMSAEETAQRKLWSQEYESIGGNVANMYEISYDQKNPVDVVKQISKEPTGAWKYLRMLWRWADTVLTATERFTRLEEYFRARKNWDTVAEAYEKSRNVSGSFHKSGIYARRITRYVPFSNAGIQLAKQFVESGVNPLSRKRVGIAMILASAISFAGIYAKIKDIDDAQTQEERDTAMDNAYRLLDKSMYEKLNYSTLGNKYKVASNPILSAPGNYIGLLMLANRIPEYKINNLDFTYQMAAGIIPNQLTPDISGQESFFGSVAGKVLGSNPITNGIINMAGYKTYPGLAPIENAGELKSVPADRYKEDTNNLAIMLGQMTWISPLRIEWTLRSILGTGGWYLTDAMWSLMMSAARKDELGIINKDLGYLIFTSPTKSAITQNQRTLRGETGNKLYAKSDEITAEIADLERRAKRILYQYNVKTSTDLPNGVTAEVGIIQKEFEQRSAELKELNKAKNALSVLSSYEVRGKQVPPNFKNSLNKYILSIDSWKTEWITKEDMDRINAAVRAYQDISKTDWATIPNAK